MIFFDQLFGYFCLWNMVTMMDLSAVFAINKVKTKINTYF